MTGISTIQGRPACRHWTRLLHGQADAFLDALQHLVLPAMVLSIAPAVAIGRIFRSSLQGVLHVDYVRTARSKGLTERQVRRADHVVRNAIGPALSMAGLQLGFMFAGVVVVEQVFSWPGIGNYLAASHPGRRLPGDRRGHARAGRDLRPVQRRRRPPAGASPTRGSPPNDPPPQHRSTAHLRPVRKETPCTCTTLAHAHRRLAVGAALTAGPGRAVVPARAAPSGGGRWQRPAPPTDGTLTVGLLGDIGQPPDPDIYYANNGTAIMINAYEGLVQYKNNTDKVEIAPRLAESWEVNPTHDVYTFHLRKGVTFHDGTPFTSAAVDVAFKRRIAVKGGAAYMVDGGQERRYAGRLHRGDHAEATQHRVPELPGLAVRPEDGITGRASRPTPAPTTPKPTCPHTIWAPGRTC